MTKLPPMSRSVVVRSVEAKIKVEVASLLSSYFGTVKPMLRIPLLPVTTSRTTTSTL